MRSLVGAVSLLIFVATPGTVRADDDTTDSKERKIRLLPGIQKARAAQETRQRRVASK